MFDSCGFAINSRNTNIVFDFDIPAIVLDIVLDIVR